MCFYLKSYFIAEVNREFNRKKALNFSKMDFLKKGIIIFEVISVFPMPNANHQT